MIARWLVKHLEWRTEHEILRWARSRPTAIVEIVLKRTKRNDVRDGENNEGKEKYSCVREEALSLR